MPAFLLVASLVPALAGPAQEIAMELEALSSPPKVALGCSTLREAIGFADSMGSFAGRNTPPQLQSLLAAARDPNAEASHGIDLDRSFLVVLGEEANIARLPIRGGLDDAIALFSQPEAPEWSIDGDRAVRIESDGKRSVLTVLEGHARIYTGPSPDPTRTQPTNATSSLAALPDSDGCAMWMHAGDDPKAPELLRHPVSMWMPFEQGAPAELRVQLPPHRDRAAQPTITPPLAVSSPARPVAVVTLGTPPARILRDPIVMQAIPDQMRSALPANSPLEDAGAGSVAAIFLDGPAPAIVAAVPITSPRGRPVSARRIVKVVDQLIAEGTLGRLGVRSEVVDRFTTQFQLPNGMGFMMRAERGRIYIGNSPAHVMGAAEGLGEPWLDDAGLAWASTHALTLTGEGPLPGLSGPMRAQLGAGTEGDLLTIQIRLEPGLRDPRVAAALQAMAARKTKGRDSTR